MDTIGALKDVGPETLKLLVYVLCALSIFKLTTHMAPVAAERMKLSATKKLNGSLEAQIRYAIGPLVARLNTLESWQRNHSGEVAEREERLVKVVADVLHLKERHDELRAEIGSMRDEIHENHVELTKELGLAGEKTIKVVSESQRILVAEIQKAIRERVR